MRKLFLCFLITLILSFGLMGIACSEDTGNNGSNGGGNGLDPLPDDVPSLVELLYEPHEGRLNEIIDILVAKGEESIPGLIGALSDPDYAHVPASQALVRIGAPAVPALIEALNAEDWATRNYAVDTLGEIGPDAYDAVEPLKDQFSVAITNRNYRVSIMYALAKIAPETDTVTMLMASLRVADLQHDAFKIIGGLGEVANHAVPGIIEFLDDEVEQVRVDAIDALESLGPLEGVVDAIAAKLEDPSDRVRNRAAEALETFGEAASGATQALAAALDDMEPSVRKSVARAFGAIAPASAGGLNALIDALDDEDPTVRNEVIQALGMFGSEASGALGRLRELEANDEFLYVRTSATQAIESIEAG